MSGEVIYLKKLLTVIAAMAAVLSLCSCASWLDTETESVQPYYGDNSSAVYSSILRAENYGQLRDSVYRIISEGSESGVVRFIGYDGDVEKDLDDVCTEIMENTAIGRYAIYSMSGTAEKIVSYYEAEITISYKIDSEEVKEMEFVSDIQSLESAVSSALNGLSTSITMYIEPHAMAYADVAPYVRDVFLQDPMSSLFEPSLAVTNVYPQNQEEAKLMGEIIRLDLSYPDTTENIESMRRFSENEIVSILLDMSTSAGDREKLFSITEKLTDGLTYLGSTSSSPKANTVYGALIDKSASGCGMALALKAICDYEGIECYTVSGQMDGREHFWNIVRADGVYRHIDPSMCLQFGFDGYFLETDEDMGTGYVWDTEKYPKCE